MKKSQKETNVAALTEELRQCHGVVVADYRGLAVKSLTQLRRSLEENGADLRVVKNTLLRRAAAAAEFPLPDSLLTGPTAVALLGEEFIAPAKTLAAFIREHRLPTLKGGVIEGRELSGAQVAALATIPSREQLLALVVGGLQSPITGLVGTLQELIARLPRTIEAVAQSRA
jgi:large subunit ribosomal protein L10